ncbi:protein still life, isoform SIF type 1 isoform X6 [Hydra vulgaris]|uniref:Protein still life, isoform SIF type 1 isoform X6 n=1 Tax=Hydra vulgaris TaxID=6087 RepID=A0ABM4BKI4_HYDVU
MRVLYDNDAGLGIDIYLPTRFKKTSDNFLQWRDKQYDGAWGLNFVSARDLKKFYRMFKTKSHTLNALETEIHTPNAIQIIEKSNLQCSINNNEVVQNLKESISGTKQNYDTKPSIRKSLIPKCSSSEIPEAYDFTEYEFLQSNNFCPEENGDVLQLSKESLDFNSSQRSLTSSLNRCSDDEDFQYARPASAIISNKQIVTTRKAAWLLVKNVLLYSKKGKLEASKQQASQKKWHKYWVALKGMEMAFYDANEKTESLEDLDTPSFSLDIDWCIAQAAPEYVDLENVFSLSTRSGCFYYLQSTSPAEVENWIHCIHSLCAGVFARRKGYTNISFQLEKEIEELYECINTDENLKKMASLQLQTEKETYAKQKIIDQISSWDNSLDARYCNMFKLKCYLSAINSKPSPNPQELLSHISRSSKHALSKIGIFSVISFHSLLQVKTVNEEKLKSSTKSLKDRLIFSLKTDQHSRTDQSKLHFKKIKDNKKNQIFNESDGETFSCKHSNMNGKKHAKLNKKGHLQGRIGDNIYVQIQSKSSVKIPFEENLKVYDLLERVCMKENLDSQDFYLILITDENLHNGLLGYTIPDEHELLDSFKYSAIKLNTKFIYDVTLSRSINIEDNGLFGLKLVQTADSIIVQDVEEGSLSHQSYVLKNDELIQINGGDLTNSSFCDILHIIKTSATIRMRFRSRRVDDSKKLTQTTENMINFLVCPLPPKCVQLDLTDDLLKSLIVPPPEDFDESKSKISSSLTISTSIDDSINKFLEITEQVNILAREMNGNLFENAPLSMKPSEKLRKSILELINTEITYTKEIKNNEKKIDAFEDVKQFQNIIYLIGKLFLEFCDKFRLYSTFCSCHSRAVKLLQVNTNEALKAFLIARNPKQQHTASLESYLITPIQRILRYPLLIKTMMKYMLKDSEEYLCMNNALTSIEKVANYINEMQRINETFTPLFQDLAKQCPYVESADLIVDNLTHFGRVQWLNEKAYSSNRGSLVQQDVVENMTVFVFKKAVILLMCEMKSRSSKKILSTSSNIVKNDLEVRFSTIISLNCLILRDHAWSQNESNQAWEIVDKSQGNEVVYAFINSTAEEKKVLINAIKESLKLYKETITSTKNINPFNTAVHSPAKQQLAIDVSKKTNIKKVASFNRKNVFIESKD